MTKKKIIFFLIYLLISNCSFGDKTGFWKGGEEEKLRASELEKKQRELIEVEKIHSSDDIYIKEIKLNKSLKLSNPKNIVSWKMLNLNNQNFIGHPYASGMQNIFLKKKIGKDKFSIKNTKTSLLIDNNYIILSDDRGTIFNLDKNGKIKWKKNIYKKLYKKIYKNLVFSTYKNNIYVADNIGFIYKINIENGDLIWIKNYGIPLKSNIKIFDESLFLIDQDNRIISLRTEDGSKVWDILAISSFIKSQKLLSIALSEKGDLVVLNSSGDLYKIDRNFGEIYWSSNTLTSLLPDATDFFITSGIVIDEEKILFSSEGNFFSYDLNLGTVIWESNVSSTSTPIIDGKNIFIVTENGYFVILNKDTGEIISSTNILKILKKKKRDTKISGFILGSEKIYSTTLNGYIIVSSAVTGEVQLSKKIGDSISSSPIIHDGKLYILTEKSKIIGFN